MRKIEMTLWALLCVMMTVNSAWMIDLGHLWSAVGSCILSLIFYRILILTARSK